MATYRDQARNLLRDYMKRVHEAAGLPWEELDGDRAMSEIVDSLILAATNNVLQLLDQQALLHKEEEDAELRRAHDRRTST